MKKKAIIFGDGSMAEVVDFYLTHDSAYEVVAFTKAGDVAEGEFLGRPLLSFANVDAQFPGELCEMFIAIGYRKMNGLREYYMQEAKEKGYKLLSYISSKTTSWPGLKIGDNAFIFEDNTIQPFVSIGDGTILWSGNHIGHHSKIGNYCFISSHVIISGHCSIGDYSFVGVNAAISDSVSIGIKNIIGPHTLIQKNTNSGEVYLTDRTKVYPKDSGRFFK